MSRMRCNPLDGDFGEALARARRRKRHTLPKSGTQNFSSIGPLPASIASGAEEHGRTIPITVIDRALRVRNAPRLLLSRLTYTLAMASEQTSANLRSASAFSTILRIA